MYRTIACRALPRECECRHSFSRCGACLFHQFHRDAPRFEIDRDILSVLHSGLGNYSLGFAVLEFGAYYSSVVQQTIDTGGTERMIVYPIMIWLIGYGNYLLGKGGQQ
jgi:hypothetical protein